MWCCQYPLINHPVASYNFFHFSSFRVKPFNFFHFSPFQVKPFNETYNETIQMVYPHVTDLRKDRHYVQVSSFFLLIKERSTKLSHSTVKTNQQYPTKYHKSMTYIQQVFLWDILTGNPSKHNTIIRYVNISKTVCQAWNHITF